MAVGLNPANLLTEFGEDIPKAENKNTEQYSRMQRSRRQDNTSKSPAILSIIPAIIVALLVIGIVLVAITLTQKSMSEKDNDPDNQQGQNEVIRNPENSNPDPNVQDENNVNDENNNDSSTESNNNKNEEIEPNIDKTKLTLTETGSGSKPESIFELSYTGDSVILKFEPTGKSWWDVVDENKAIIDQGFTTENEPIEIDVSGKNRIRLNIGAANFIPVISINDIKLDYPVDPNQFVNQLIWIDLSNETE